MCPMAGRGSTPDRYAAAPIRLGIPHLPSPVGSGTVHKDDVTGSDAREVAARRLPGSNRIA
jgi:hypothetical protein